MTCLSMKARHRQNRLGLLACVLLALPCLGLGIASTVDLLHLLAEGERTQGIVSGIDVAPGIRSARYLPDDIDTPEKGDRVRIIYDPRDPETATVDLGLWTWRQPALFYVGSVFLAALALLLGSMFARERYFSDS